MRTHIAVVGGCVAAVSGALLVGACGGGSNSQEAADQPRNIETEAIVGGSTQTIDVDGFGPDVRIKSVALPQDGVKIWANVSANDDSGISVQGIKARDTVQIESIAGVGWFSGQSAMEKFLSTVHAAGTFVGAAAPAGGLVKSVADQTKTLTAQGSNRGSGNNDYGKPRDGYGRGMDGEFHTDEGGIIVCMPSSLGPMYANDDNHLSGVDKKEGRLEKNYTRSEMYGKCHFPNRVDPKNEWEAKDTGVLYILAFDSDYGDNSGSYEVQFRITRPPASQ